MLQPGDHLRVWRGVYDHHGIYMGCLADECYDALEAPGLDVRHCGIGRESP